MKPTKTKEKLKIRDFIAGPFVIIASSFLLIAWTISGKRGKAALRLWMFEILGIPTYNP